MRFLIPILILVASACVTEPVAVLCVGDEFVSCYADPEAEPFDCMYTDPCNGGRFQAMADADCRISGPLYTCGED